MRGSAHVGEFVIVFMKRTEEKGFQSRRRINDEEADLKGVSRLNWATLAYSLRGSVCVSCVRGKT